MQRMAALSSSSSGNSIPIMDATEFVSLWKAEKQIILELLDREDSHVTRCIADMALTERQRRKLRHVIELVLSDTLYTLLLGLDGAAPIGNVQACYTIYDSDHRLISRDGCLAYQAHAHFRAESQ
ncbi:hypothetical protein [Dyella nitratireducens]|uniref:Uncharacterized protein n=1 Tax=Dyella nitratireducens TaxID=1849580 RepID=A0ABQ1FSJ3_9GAMM|nr:hypothetical protein [Dyella nitratireducens]GGA29365.1 hypothetical protein GCM10010981_17840 [Dyella nitratireducens]GLQ43151.1 hypothetical protein GCM10007902_30010 [Dyella nitratireducens]